MTTTGDADPRLETVFAEALRFDSPEGRARYLAEACRGNAGLLAAAEAMVRDHFRLGGFLGAPAFPPGTVAHDEGVGKGSIVGRYRIIEEIDRGGMGIVYLAEQFFPVRRGVALKLIRPGKGSPTAVARFEAEREALTRMSHQNIATIYDGGSTGGGQPYFVMELIRGQKIDEYCDTHRLSVERRLELFVQVCRAVQHAHTKGIIHRDLKPSNILVATQDGEPVSKVIDFGIAKALGHPLTDKALVTGFDVIMGTLLYMAPEQAESTGSDVDAKSDVYSLGVLLYQLLAGSLPFEEETLRRAGVAEVLRMIREVEPPSPSTRLDSLGDTLPGVSSRRGLDPRRLRTTVSGELDRIVMQALRKQRWDRYESVNALASDVQNYLSGDPVQAKPQPRWYKQRKFAARHRASIAAALVAAVALASATALSTNMAVRATRSEADTRSVQDFFGTKVLAAPRPEGVDGGLGHDLTLRSAIDAAEPDVAKQFAGRPAVEADVRDTLGMSYWHLGEPSLAAKQFDRTLALRRDELGARHPATLEAMNNLASAYADLGRYDRAVQLAREAFESRSSVLGPNHPDTLTSMNNLAVDLKLGGRNDEALALSEKVLALRRAVLGVDHPDTIATMNNTALALASVGRTRDAQQILREAYDLRRSSLGPDHLETMVILDALASAYAEAGMYAEAIPRFEHVLAVRKAKLPFGHFRTLGSMNNLAATLWNAGRKAQAIATFEEALAAHRKKLGPDHPNSMTLAYNLAVCYRGEGQPGKAVPLFEEVLTYYRDKPGPEDGATLTTMNQLAGAYLDANRYPDAERLSRECLAVRERTGPESWERYLTTCQLGRALASLGRYEEAEPLLVDGHKGLVLRESEIPAPQKKRVGESAAGTAAMYESWGKASKAAEWRAKASPQPGSRAPVP